MTKTIIITETVPIKLPIKSMNSKDLLGIKVWQISIIIDKKIKNNARFHKTTLALINPNIDVVKKAK